MLGCGVCGGIWLDNDAAQKVTHHYSDHVVRMAERASQSAQRKPDVRSAAKCAQCRTEMDRRTFGMVSVDVCGEHGTWFDAGELSTLVAATRPLPPAPTSMAAANFTDTSSSSVASDVAGDVAIAVAEGAFAVLLGVLTD